MTDYLTHAANQIPRNAGTTTTTICGITVYRNMYGWIRDNGESVSVARKGARWITCTKCDPPAEDKFHGYTVTKLEGNKRLAYELSGPRGAHYGLSRTHHAPTKFFIVNLRPDKYLNVVTISGNAFLREIDGKLHFV